jgi:hypothetical protein
MTTVENIVPEKKPKQDDPEQSKRFLEAAKAAGADETEKGAARAFKAVVKPRSSTKRRTEEAMAVAKQYRDDQLAILKKLFKN